MAETDIHTGKSASESPRKPARKHLIRCGWVRVPLKVLMWLLVFILLIPVLIYVPPVQSGLKNLACKILQEQTGMQASIGRLRLRWPLDVELDSVRILEASGDTMVMASSLIADVKLMPLLHGDVQANKIELLRGFYRMTSADSSMNLRLQAGYLSTEAGTEFDLKNMRLKLVNPVLKDARVNVSMNIWKQKKDTTNTPTKFYIEANRLELSNVTYSMQMLPTIADLRVKIGSGLVRNAVLNLTDNLIKIGSVKIEHGDATYLTPTAEWAKAHPAPADTAAQTGPPSPPMTIEIGMARLGFDRALYATQGAKPQPGFDPSYIEATDIQIDVDDFYNQTSTVRLPIVALSAKERSGLQITQGSGTLQVDSAGLTLQDFSVLTPASSLRASAVLPFELMAMNPKAPAGSVEASGQLAWSDIFAFMPPMRKEIARYIPSSAMAPLNFNLTGSGSLQQISIRNLALGMGRFLTLNATGSVENPLNMKRLKANLKFDGAMRDPSSTLALLNKIAGLGKEVRVPTFQVSGLAQINGQNYSGDIRLLTSAGNLAAQGSLSVNSETFDLHADMHGLDLDAVMPSLGVGTLTGSIDATGAGFNPLLPHSDLELTARLSQVSYRGNSLAPLSLDASARSGQYTLDLSSGGPHSDLTLTGTGSLRGHTYFADLTAHANYVDLQALGLIDEICRGSGDISLSGSANPSDMLFDLQMSLDDIDWEFAENFYSFHHAFQADFQAERDLTALHITGDQLAIDFTSPLGLRPLLACTDKIMPAIKKQIDSRQIDFETLQPELPQFTLKFDSGGEGLLHEILDGTGYTFSSLSASLSNTDRLQGNAQLLQAADKSMTLDTVTLALTQQGQRMNYRLHIGNLPSRLPELADVNLTGYIGGNRASLFLRQKNAKGEVGYRLGLTAALLDSAINLHFTPVNARIAYQNWSVNDDNYIQLGPGQQIAGDLAASSGHSSISVHTVTSDNGHPGAEIGLKNLMIQDFLPLFGSDMPPVTGGINADMRLYYLGKAVGGTGSLGVKELVYDGQSVGDLDFNFKAGVGFNGNTGCSLGLLLNKKEVLRASGYLIQDTTTSRASTLKHRAKLKLDLIKFPADIANPFLDPEMMRLSGHLNGEMQLTGSMSAPLINGAITCDSVGVYFPMAASWLRFSSEQEIAVNNNRLNFTDFNLYAAGKNPITLNGFVDASNLNDINFDLALNGDNVCLINNKNRNSDIYGQLYMTLGASARGNLDRMKIDGDISILPATNIFYTLTTTSSTITTGSTTDVVKFINFADSTLVAATDSLQKSTTAMRINAELEIVNGAQATVNITGAGSGKVQIAPSGKVSFVQTYMGDRRLNGTLNLGSGSATYSVPVMGEKNFTINPTSYVTFTGDMMNPTLHLEATDHLKANVQQEGANSRLIYFDIGLSVTGTLQAPKVMFDLSTDEDITVQNELQSMSPDQRSAAAINMLLYNTYTGPGVKASANLGANPLFSLLEGQLNSFASKYITGVDLSFGIDQYNKTVNGQNNNTTSYSYQVSKSLFDNRFKIVVGGNYTTDANADENFAQNLISNISFEYSLKQTASTSMYVRLFRHTDFESILEGEVTETGVGFVLRRKIQNLRRLFNFARKKKAPADTAPAPEAPKPQWQKVSLPADTTTNL